VNGSKVGKLASGNDVFLGTSLGGSSAGESGRSSTITALRQRVGECGANVAESESEKAASELCNSRDFAPDSSDEMLRNGFSGSELSIHSGSPAGMSDVDSSDHNSTMIGELFDAATASDSKPDASSEVVDKMVQSSDLDMSYKLAEVEDLPSSELQTKSDGGEIENNNGRLSPSDADNNLTCVAANDNGSSSPSSSESDSSSTAESPMPDDLESVTETAFTGSDDDNEHVMPGLAMEQSSLDQANQQPQSLDDDDDHDDVVADERSEKTAEECPTASTTPVLEKLLNEPTPVLRTVCRAPNPSTAVDSQFCTVHQAELNSPSVADSRFTEANAHGAMAAHHVSRDHPQHFVVRSTADIGQASTVSQQGFVTNPVASSSTTQPTGQFTPAFVSVGSPSPASNVPRVSCPTPGMENVVSSYLGGYRRLSSGSGSHIQPHLVSPEMNSAEQRMNSPASYCTEYAPAKQGSYSTRPLHDASYQSAGGPHSVKSSPGAAVGSPNSGCAMMSPNGSYGRAQSFGSLTHSPATRVDQSPGSGSFTGGSSSGLAGTQQGSFNQPNPSPSGSGGTGWVAGMPKKSPVANTNVFSPAAPAAISPSFMAVTSAMSGLSQNASIVPFSCNLTDGVPPFHFPTNVAVPVSATTYAGAPSPTPHSLQLLSPSSTTNRVTAGYQTVSTTASVNTVQRHHSRQQSTSSAIGLPYYGIPPSLPANMSYTGMIVDHRFTDAPLDQLMSTFSPSAGSGGGRSQIPHGSRTDCSLVQLQQLTSRLGSNTPQPPPLDMSYGISPDTQSMGLLPPKSDPFGRVVGQPLSGPAVNQACRQSSGRRRAATSEKTSPVGSITLSPHAASYNMLDMFHHPQRQPSPHASASPIDYQRYLANAGFFGQGAPPMQMMPSFRAPVSRSSTPFMPQPSSQLQGGGSHHNVYSSYNYVHFPTDAFTDLPRR